MAKAGDILKFAEPLNRWDKELLDKGGQYVVRQSRKVTFYQTPDGWWHSQVLEELEPLHICLETHNGGFDYGKLADYQIKYEVIGSVE